MTYWSDWSDRWINGGFECLQDAVPANIERYYLEPSGWLHKLDSGDRLHCHGRKYLVKVLYMQQAIYVRVLNFPNYYTSNLKLLGEVIFRTKSCIIV